MRKLLRTNLLLNPLARITGNLDLGPNISVAYNPSGAVVTHNNGAVAGNAFFAVQTAPLVNGKTYYARFIADVVSGAPSVFVAYHSVVGASVNNARVTPINNVLSRDFSFVASATTGRLLADFENTGTGESYRLREMVISETPFTTYWDGSFPETPTRFWKWTGVKNNSTSEEYEVFNAEGYTPTKAITDAKQAVFDKVLGANPVRTLDGTFSDVRYKALEKVLTDNGLI